MPAVRRPRPRASSIALAALSLGLTGPARAAAIYPDGLGDAALVQWLGQETDLRPAQVVAISRGSVAGVIARTEVSDGIARVTVRLEATTPPAPLPNDVEILSSQVDVAVDCNRRLVRQGASTGHPERNLAGTGYIIADQDTDWRFPTVGTLLDAVWRSVCDPGFVRPLAPQPLRASVQPHPRGRRVQLAQAGRPRPPAAAKPRAAPVAQAKTPAAAPPAASTAAPPAKVEELAAAPAPAPEPPLKAAAAAPAPSTPQPEAPASQSPAPEAAAPAVAAATAPEPPAPSTAPPAPAVPQVSPSPVAGDLAAPPAEPAPEPSPKPAAAPADAPAPPAATAEEDAASLNFALRVRLGAFSAKGEAAEALQRLLARNLTVLNGRAAFVGPAEDGRGFAIEVAGFEDAHAAAAACSVLAMSDGPCAVVASSAGTGRPARRASPAHGAH